jgi:predicted RNA-binding Zn-ribbon protein involved in translation (DUF1610 family)
VSIGTTKTKTGKTKSLFSVTCPFCGEARKITRHDHATRLANHRCKTCSNKNNHPQGESHGIRVSWFNKYKLSAQHRGLEWDLEIQDVAVVLAQQTGRCALSGLWLVTRGPFDGITASIDRIDNSMGYTKSNIQLVHKKVNMMRGSLTIQEFQKFCKAVADKVKW